MTGACVTCSTRPSKILFARSRHAVPHRIVPGAPGTPVQAKSRDGLDLVSYPTLPTDIKGDRPPKPLPMVAHCPWWPLVPRQLRLSQRPQLADRGYAVLSVNWRLRRRLRADQQDPPWLRHLAQEGHLRKPPRDQPPGIGTDDLGWSQDASHGSGVVQGILRTVHQGGEPAEARPSSSAVRARGRAGTHRTPDPQDRRRHRRRGAGTVLEG
jgi:hypothetical protein